MSNWTKHNKSVYQFSDPHYYVYHTKEHLLCRAGNVGNWHIVFYPELGNGKATVLGKQMTNISERNVIIWAENIITKHQ